KGNYPLLSKFAQKSPIFLNYPNKRSVLYIDNLCKFLQLMIINEEKGIYHPQNQELIQTSEMVNQISSYYNHEIWFTKLGNPFINLFFRVNLIKKVFGNLYYDHCMSVYKKGNYQIYNLKESIELTEEQEI